MSTAFAAPHIGSPGASLAPLDVATRDLPPAHRPSMPVAEQLAAFLDGEYAELKTKVRAVLARPSFAHLYDIDRTQHREAIWTRCRELARNGWGAEVFPDSLGRSDVPKFLAIFETLGVSDPNLVIKFGLQFGLFGGAIFYLGTRRHHELLAQVASLQLVGCYAMSEVGHGSDTHRLETVARYDHGAGQFVIDTPTATARKQFIGNAAMHANTAVVFAQLEVDQIRRGVFGFLVPIRNSDGGPCNGVRIGDTGPKVGLTGVDNGWLCFDQVRIPRENLLDRFGTVTAAGLYQSDSVNPTAQVQRAMSGGRIAIAAGALSAAKAGLTIAIRYGARRRQFGGKQERLLLDYPLHQRRLLPRLATAYAMDAALKYATSLAHHTDAMVNPQFEELTALLKAYSTWTAIATLQECREACGGQGYLAHNRIGILRADVDPMTTLEGDNSLLYLFAAKMQLTRLRDQHAEAGWTAPIHDVVKGWRERAAAMWSLRTGQLLKNHQPDHFGFLMLQPGSQQAGEGRRRSLDSQGLSQVLEFREHALLWEAAQRLRPSADRHGGTDHQTPLMELSQARAERIAFDQFCQQVNRSPDSLRAMLGLVRDLFGISCLSRHAAWYLQRHVMIGSDARRIEGMMTTLCHDVRPYAVTLVDGFAIPGPCLGDLDNHQETVER